MVLDGSLQRETPVSFGVSTSPKPRALPEAELVQRFSASGLVSEGHAGKLRSRAGRYCAWPENPEFPHFICGPESEIGAADLMMQTEKFSAAYFTGLRYARSFYPETLRRALRWVKMFLFSSLAHLKNAGKTLTADRSTTELRWITQLKKTRVGIFAHDWLQATANALIGLRIDAYSVAATIF